MVLAVMLPGCAITIQQPANNASVTSPARAVVTGNAAFSGLRVSVNGNDVSNQMMPTSPSRAEGDLSLPLGLNTITATATVPCWYCSGGSTQSTDSKSFVAVSGNARVCARSASPPVISLDPQLASVAQSPGRKFIGYQLRNGIGILIIVDDAPGLLKTQMLVEVDLDPARGPMDGKMIEAWDFCQTGSAINAVTTRMDGGFGEGVICNGLSAANDFRSGCTLNSPPMLINQATTKELWLRRSGFFGILTNVEAIDQSIWQVFGGRRLRFIWLQN